MRFPLEVFDAVRAEVPADKPVGVKVSATDWIQGGWDVEQTIAFVRELKQRGVDWISVSSGGISPLQKIPSDPDIRFPSRRRKGGDGGQYRCRRPDHPSAAGRSRSSQPARRTGSALARGMLYDPPLGLARRSGARRRHRRCAAVLLAGGAARAQWVVPARDLLGEVRRWRKALDPPTSAIGGSSPPFEDRPDRRTSATPARWTGRIVRPGAPALTDPATPLECFHGRRFEGPRFPRSTAVELWAPTIPLTSLCLPCEIGALGRSKAAPSRARGDHGAADGHGEGTS